VASKKIKREALLPYKVYSRHFVIKYGESNNNYGIFFGLSRKFCKAVKRNKVKRIFRELVKEKLSVVNNEENNFSICLISKKYSKLEKDIKIISELKKEMEDLLDKIIKNYR
jgi:ribonuclease P protein component